MLSANFKTLSFKRYPAPPTFYSSFANKKYVEKEIYSPNTIKGILFF